MEQWRNQNPEKWKIINNRSGKAKFAKQIALTRKIRQANPCVICKESRANCLQFHHIDPAVKIRGIAVFQGVNKLKEELAKCLVLCANCHALYHAGDIQIPDDAKPLNIAGYFTP